MTRAPWQTEPWERLLARRAQGRLPHALLLCGPEGLGQRAFAEALGALLLCDRDGAAACGECRSCRLYAARVQRDPEEMRPDGSLAQPYGHPGHPDACFVGHVLNEKSSPKKMFSELVVEQMRGLSEWLALTPHYGRAKFALIDPADALNIAAANALLKTLEEPNPGCYIALVSSKPARLPATIRSRCQRVEFRTPPPAVAQAWLVAQGIDAAAAAGALEASGGNPELARAWVKSGELAARAEVAQDLRGLYTGKASAVDVANRWSKDDTDTRLWFAAMLVQAEARAQACGATGPLALTARPELTKLSAWFDRANRARELLRGPLRPELVVLEALSAMTE